MNSRLGFDSLIDHELLGESNETGDRAKKKLDGLYLYRNLKQNKKGAYPEYHVQCLSFHVTLQTVG